MLERNKSSRSRPKLIRRPKRKPAGPIRPADFSPDTPHTVTALVIEDDDADDPIIVWGGTRFTTSATMRAGLARMLLVERRR